MSINISIFTKECEKEAIIFLFWFRCGINPRIWEMTGSDADILCGEWDSNGSTDPSTSGERFNIALTIKQIVRHPDYRNNLDNEQSYLQNDIAVFKVDEYALSKVKVSLRPYYSALVRPYHGVIRYVSIETSIETSIKERL